LNLSLSSWQQVSDAGLAPPSSEDKEDGSVFDIGDEGETQRPGHRLETAVLTAPSHLEGPRDVVPLLVASAPLLPSGEAILGRLPPKWLEFSGRSDSLGTRCLFTSRRHEHSVFAPLGSERLLQVPPAARDWQPLVRVPGSALEAAAVADEEAWSVQVHPGQKAVRVLVRPGVLLMRMLRGGTALPSARFTWRVVDASTSLGGAGGAKGERPASAATVGEFSILSNLEDAAHTQPPNFIEFPLRREQLRSLGWMVSQEQRRREAFATELRATAPCPDAPHWQLEGSLRCEYKGVRGGVLADAIGYGKTACTIGLIDSTMTGPPPLVPAPFAGFIPTRATLVLAPTNLHAQWLAEITKFTGKTLKVLSVPTCAQLKRITMQELAEADVVVATYRLFYSAPYLKRLEELARGQRQGLTFPRLPGQAAKGAGKPSPEWARAYRAAFEALPAWAAQLGRGSGNHPVTPARKHGGSSSGDGSSVSFHRAGDGEEDESVPSTQAPPKRASPGAAVASEGLGSPSRRRLRSKGAPAAEPKNSNAAAATAAATVDPDQPGKRRRIIGKSTVARPPEWAEAVTKAYPFQALTTQYVPLEAFWWRRVVCDEFHELLGRYPPAQVAVELFHADYKWGLSGTPPCQTLAQIRKAAGFLGVQLPGAAAAAPSAAAGADGGEAPRQVAQEWLDAFVRRNTSELPPLEEEEVIIPVRQTPEERALYLALTEQQMRAGGAAKEPLDLQTLRQGGACNLLKLCSHFCLATQMPGKVLSAEDECARQLSMRQTRVNTAEKEIRDLAERASYTARLVRHFDPHFGCRPEAANYAPLAKESKAAISARLHFLGAPCSGVKADLLTRLFERLSRPEVSEVVKDMALRPDFDTATAGSASDLPPPDSTWLDLESENREDEPVARAVREFRLAVESGDGSLVTPSRCLRHRTSLGMPPWPVAEADKEVDAAELKERERACRDATWAWRSDAENEAQLQPVLEGWKAELAQFAARLLELRDEVAERAQNVRSFQETLQASQAEALQDDDGVVVCEAVPHFKKYGSKIELLIKHIQKVQAGEPGCKIICFVQWEDLKRKISSALEEFELEHITLHGSVWARRTALTKFQYEEDGPRMLLLSLEESASGTNLTAANHVIIVHPMDAATKEEAVAFEMQAMGRVRRPGQQRKIHIWRFVTMGTIEQKITEEHQKELWERQSAKILVSQPGPCDLDGESCDEAEEEDEAMGAEEAQTIPGGVGAGGSDSATQVYMAPEASTPLLGPRPTARPTPTPVRAGSSRSSQRQEAEVAARVAAEETLAYSADDMTDISTPWSPLSLPTSQTDKLGAKKVGAEAAVSTQRYADPDATQSY